MGLLVWLPLIGDIHNQGLLNITTSAYGVLTYEDGKLGNAVRIGEASGGTVSKGVDINSNLIDELGTEYSCSVWVKPTGNHQNYEGCIISSGNWNDTTWSFGLNQTNTKVSVMQRGYNNYIDCEVPVDTWTHLVSTAKNGVAKLYKNGEYIGSRNIANPQLVSSQSFTRIGNASYINYFTFNGLIQDVRLYNEELNPCQIKYLSKGLVLHYPLSRVGGDNLLIPQIKENNKWVNWRNNTTWDSENTRERVIIDGKTWAHVHQILSTGYGGYACDPSYNGIVIDTSKRYTWSCLAKAGTDTNAKIILWCHWRSTEGGYNLSQNSTTFNLSSTPTRIAWTLPVYTNSNYTVNRINLMMGVSGTANNEVYFTDVKFEEGTIDTPWIPNSLDLLYSAMGLDNGIIYDVSGYGNNGTIIGSLAYSSDTPRYLGSTYITNGSVGHIEGIPLPISSQTLCMWVKCDKTRDQCVFCDKNAQLEFGFFHNAIYIRTVSQHGYSTTHWNDNEWNHIAVIKENNGVWNLYINGQLETNNASSDYYIHNADNFWIGNRSFNNSYPSLNCFISDVRIYATALSADDILALYHTPTSIANNGTLLTQGEISEV